MDLQIVINNKESLKDFLSHGSYSSLLSEHELVDVDVFNNQVIVNYRRKVTTPNATNSTETQQPDSKGRVLPGPLPQHPQLGFGVDG